MDLSGPKQVNFVKEQSTKYEVPSTKYQVPSTKYQVQVVMITVYEKPTCTKCREMNKFLVDQGIDFSKVNYYIEPLDEKKLSELLRTTESIYRELGLGKKDLSDDEIVALMVKHPDLMQRPIVERGERAVLGRPVENVKELL